MHARKQATGDPIQENPPNFPKSLLGVDNFSQLSVSTACSFPSGECVAGWIFNETGDFHKQVKSKLGP